MEEVSLNEVIVTVISVVFGALVFSGIICTVVWVAYKVDTDSQIKLMQAKSTFGQCFSDDELSTSTPID